MKKFFSKTVFAVAAIAAGLSSCSHDNVYTPDDPFQKQEALYNKAFAEQFGTPAANHDWGFGNGSRAAVSRTADTNSNQWADYIKIPNAITAEEAQAVYEYFADKSHNKLATQLNYCDFFVQHVWKGTDSYETIDWNGHTHQTVGGDHMDRLFVCESADAMAANQIDHVNNLNNSNGSIMHMVNTTTAHFGYQNSSDSGKYYDKYIILNVPGYGYYVGFDWQLLNTPDGQYHEGDDVYTDWIVKICPGEYKDAQRVIAEDLGAVGDFDFNDVVFDVAPLSQYNNPYTVITVRAAGGTMPIYIEGKEVHELFGVETKTMVNTGAKACPVAQFTISGYKQAKDINITVDNGEFTFVLNNPVGNAPKKICVGTDYEWCAEKQNIKAKYPKFNDYVADPSKTNAWYK